MRRRPPAGSGESHRREAGFPGTGYACTGYEGREGMIMGGGQMDERAMSEALDAIHDEAMRLLELDHSPEAEAIIGRIISLARYKHDVRTDQERGTKKA